MTARDAARLKAGFACLVLSGILTAVGLFLRGPVIIPAENPQLWAETALIGTHDLAWLLLLPNLTVQIFGFAALYFYVKDTPQDRLAFWGVVLSIVGNGIFLPFTGILAYTDPELARLYLDGNEAMIEVAMAGVEGPLSYLFLAGSGIILLVGSILVTLLLWRSPKYPTWTSPLYLIHAVGLTIAAPVSYVVERTGGIMLLIVAVGIAVHVWPKIGPDKPDPA